MSPFFRSLASRLALGFLVLFTSLGLVTTTSQTAQADAVDEIVKVAAGVGTVGVRAAPAVATGLGVTVCATGVGCVIMGAAALGIAAYATRDYWLPWVSNELAQLGVLTGWGADPGGTLSWISEPALDGSAHPPFTIRGAYKGTGDGFHYTSIFTKATCKNLTTGVVRSTGGYLQPDKLFQASGGYVGMFGATNPTDGTFYGCSDGESMLGVSVRADVDQNAPSGTAFEDVASAWNSLAVGRLLEDVNDGTYTSSVNCRRPDGSNYAVTRTSTPAQGIAGAVKVGFCDAGDVMTGGNISTGGTVVSEWTMPTEAEVAALYPNCVGANEGNCTYVIKINGEPCAASILACQGWTQTNITSPGTVSCWYGPYQLELATCGWLERAYEPEGAGATKLNTDGNPATWDSPQPQWQTQPTPSPTNTATVQPSPSPTVSATASPTQSASASPTATATSTAGTGGEATPGGAGQPSPSDSAGTECFPSGWGVFNPAEWVLKPVKCALYWAFVPAGVGESVTDWWDVNKANLGGTSLGQWWMAFGAWGSAFSAAGGQVGCQGPGLPTGFLGARGVMPAVIHPWDACSGPKAVAAATVHGLLTVSIGFFSAWRLVRIVGKPFGYSLDLMNGRGEGK